MVKRIKNLVARLSLIGVDYDKLHLGCGGVILPGWLNIDFDPSFSKEIYPLDLREPLPFPDDSVDMIFSEHTIEHLAKADGLNFLKECFRVLRKDGAIRLGWPDFTKLLGAYIKKDNKYKVGMLKHMGASLTGNWDEFIADLLFSWDHKYCYTPNLLKKYMRVAGFEKVKVKSFGESDLGFNVDTRNDPDTTYIEAKKQYEH